jgi:hypothetical protein
MRLSSNAKITGCHNAKIFYESMTIPNIGGKSRIRSGFLPEQEMTKNTIANPGDRRGYEQSDDHGCRRDFSICKRQYSTSTTNPISFLTFDICPLSLFSNKTTSSFPLLLLAAFYTHLSYFLYQAFISAGVERPRLGVML